MSRRPGQDRAQLQSADIPVVAVSYPSPATLDSGGGRGGDRRALQRLHDRPAEHGALLLTAMMNDPSQCGERFRVEHEKLFRRHQRLIHALRTVNVTGLQPGGPRGVWDVHHYFELARFGPPRLRPAPRGLTSDEMNEALRRKRVVEQAVYDGAADLHQSFGAHVPVNCPHCISMFNSLHEWADEPRRAANPRSRACQSRRRMVRAYEVRVDAFCAAWHLPAPWAKATVVMHHFWRDELGRVLAYDDLVAGTAYQRQFVRIIARLPGVSDAAFARDAARFRDAEHVTVLDADTPDQVIVRRRPSRAELAEREREHNAACVVVDWDGGQCRDPSRDQPIDVGTYIAYECQRRLGRLLTDREWRGIKHDISPQLQRARALFRSGGWGVSGHTDPRRRAQWLATYLLSHGQTTFEEIAEQDARAHLNGVDPSTVRKACHTVADTLGLVLP